VPPKLSAQVRVFATGNGRKMDPVDAHSVAMAAFHNHGLLHVEVDDDLLVLGMLADRRDELGRARTQTVNRLHRLLLELLAGGPKKDLSAKQARELIVTVKPRDLPGKTRRRLAVELIGERESIDRKIKTGDKEIEALVLERDSTLMDLFGIAAASAVRLLVDVGDIHRFANRDRFASWNGTAPLDVSSGQPGTPSALPRRQPAHQPNDPHHGDQPAPPPDRRPRLLRPTQSRRHAVDDGPARPETPTVERHLRPHARRPDQTRSQSGDGPGWALGERLCLQRGRLTPWHRLFEKPHPGPASTKPRTGLPAAS